MRLVLIISALIFSIYGTAQNSMGSIGSSGSFALFQDDDGAEEGGFGFAINIGMYYANKKSAFIYDGSCRYEFINPESGVQCYTIRERLGIDDGLFNNPNTRSEIINDLQLNGYPNVSNYYAADDMYPENVRYQGAFFYGLNLSYNFDDLSAIVLNSNFMNIEAKDAFVLILEGQTQQVNEPQNRELFTVWGEESRFNIRLGWKQGWEVNENSRWIFEFGGSMLGAKLEANKILLGSREYDLILGGNLNQFIQYQPRSQVGFGFYVTPGFEFVFQDKITAMLGASFAREKLKLEAYEVNLWNSSVFLRLGI